MGGNRDHVEYDFYGKPRHSQASYLNSLKPSARADAQDKLKQRLKKRLLLKKFGSVIASDLSDFIEKGAARSPVKPSKERSVIEGPSVAEKSTNSMLDSEPVHPSQSSVALPTLPLLRKQ